MHMQVPDVWHDGAVICPGGPTLDPRVKDLARWQWHDPCQQRQSFIVNNAISDRFQGPILTKAPLKSDHLLSSWAQQSMTGLILRMGAPPVHHGSHILYRVREKPWMVYHCLHDLILGCVRWDLQCVLLEVTPCIQLPQQKKG